MIDLPLNNLIISLISSQVHELPQQYVCGDITISDMKLLSMNMIAVQCNINVQQNTISYESIS